MGSLAVPMNPICDMIYVAQMKQMPPQEEYKPQYGVKDKDHEQRDVFINHCDSMDHMAIPEPMCYFWSADTYVNSVDSAKTVGKKFKEFAHNMLDGIKYAIDMWRIQAKFQDLKVNAVTALGTPGCLKGPKIESLIKSAPQVAPMSAWGESTQDWIDAVSKGVSNCFGEWQDGVIVPGLPWYPAFAAFPGPMAPPMPNIPTPLITCPSAAGMPKMTPTMLKDAMTGAYSPDDPWGQFDAMATAIGTGLATAFLAWLPAQQVMTVMGKGQIPTFAPPYVPVGPVVMGDNLPIPGHTAV